MPSFINQGNGAYDIHDLVVRGRNKDAYRTVFNLPSEIYNVTVDGTQRLNLARETQARNCSFTSDGDSFYISAPYGVTFEDCDFSGLIGAPNCPYIPGIDYYGGIDLHAGGKLTPSARFYNCKLTNCGFFLNGKGEDDGRDFVQLYFENCTLSDIFINDIKSQSFVFKKCQIKNVNSRYQVVKRVVMENCVFDDVRGEQTSGFNSADLEMINTKASLKKYCYKWAKSSIKAIESDIVLDATGNTEGVSVEVVGGTMRTNIKESGIKIENARVERL